MKKTKDFKNSAGFTLIEMLVVIAIIAILAAVALYNVTQYINKGRDSTVRARLIVLITAGELWYDRHESEYTGFCDEDISPAVKSVWDEIPSTNKYCNDTPTAWAACAKLFVEPDKAYCVDNKGNQKKINNSYCDSDITNCCVGGVSNCIH